MLSCILQSRSAVAVSLPVLLFSSSMAPAPDSTETFPEKPNILWLSAEDMSPRIGAYGDTVARTPNIDQLAAAGRMYTNVFTSAAVCSPNRASIITGMHPSSFGAHHMRTLSGAPYAPPPAPYSAVPPPYVKAFTEYLRAEGYYCTNNVKEDYQFETPFTAWDESSNTAHWRNRPDPEQPFFSVFNFMITHESRVWPKPDEQLITDPAAVELPPYMPDTPVIRADYARFYDNIATMDGQVGELLRQLEEDGLADKTVVFFWSDHGDGLPRAKKWLFDTGLHVPLIIRAPGVIPEGEIDDRLIGFVDLAPTILSIVGIDVPVHMQGFAFLGSQTQPERDFIYASRDRNDEQYDMVRAVRDKRFKYIRNYYPHKPYTLMMAYPNNMPSMQELYRLNAEGKLEGAQKLFFQNRRPVHELYDTNSDPWELNNLARDPAYADVLERFQQAMDDWMLDIGDLGSVPETEMVERFWPNGEQPATGAPAIVSVNRTETMIGLDGTIPASVSGGSFEGPVIVTMYSPTQGASIGYTLEEGNDARWLLFSEPLTISETTTIRAKAIRYGYRESEETRATFEISGG